MNDSDIVALYFERDESAILRTDEKYGKYCFRIANNILSDKGESEESVNDTYDAAWRAIPPHKPTVLSAFLAKLCRRISIDKLRKRTAGKRAEGGTALVLDELSECVSSDESITDELERKRLREVINRFVGALSDSERRVFILRYFHMYAIESISFATGFSESKIKSMLMRIRGRLRTVLEKEELL